MSAGWRSCSSGYTTAAARSPPAPSATSTNGWPKDPEPATPAATSCAGPTRNGHASNVETPSRPQGPLRVEQASDLERWTATRQLLHDDTLSTSDRAAGLLVLLFGQSLTRISQLTTGDVHDTGTYIKLALAKTPVDIPPPLDTLLRHLVDSRQGRATVGHTDAHPWLFPGGAPGHPVSTVTLRRRLTRLGIKPRAARNGTLMTIAAQLPAVVISDLLGITIATATSWTSEAGSPSNAYAAELARRTATSWTAKAGASAPHTEPNEHDEPPHPRTPG